MDRTMHTVWVHEPEKNPECLNVFIRVPGWGSMCTAGWWANYLQELACTGKWTQILQLLIYAKLSGVLHRIQAAADELHRAEMKPKQKHVKSGQLHLFEAEAVGPCLVKTFPHVWLHRREAVNE